MLVPNILADFSSLGSLSLSLAQVILIETNFEATAMMPSYSIEDTDSLFFLTTCSGMIIKQPSCTVAVFLALPLGKIAF